MISVGCRFIVRLIGVWLLGRLLFGAISNTFIRIIISGFISVNCMILEWGLFVRFH